MLGVWGQMRMANAIARLLHFVVVVGGVALVYAPYARYGAVLRGLVVLYATFVVLSSLRYPFGGHEEKHL